MKSVELHDAEALGVVDVVAEHGGEALRLGVLHRAAEVASQAVAVEDVVAEDERAGLASGELLADDEGLGEARRGWAGRRRTGSRRSPTRRAAGARSSAGPRGWR